MATCYRHPNRETGVSCSNCGNPICPDCMTATPVGMRCPDCAGQKTRVHTARTMYVAPTVTYVIIGICVLLFFGAGGSFGGGGGNKGFRDFALWGPLVAEGEYWRLVTSGFMHSGLLHLGFNMYILYWLGTQMEPSLGHLRFAALYLASLLSGSFGVMLLDPNAVTVGASGAVFGLMAAAFVMQHARGINPMQSGLGMLILLNLGITFLVPNISIGGHLGGLVGGIVATFALMRYPTRGPQRMVGMLVAVGVGVASVAIAYARVRGYVV